MSANLSYDPLAGAVPRESLGQARAFRNVLIAEDSQACTAIDRILSPLHARLAQGRIPRTESLADAANQWRNQLAGTGRLDVSIEQTRTSLTIRELRVGASDNRFDDWPEGDVEPGFAVQLISISIHRRKDKSEWVSLAGLSLHAIARWHQRAWCNSTDALRADIWAFAQAIDGVNMSSGEFSISVANGRWAGLVMKITDRGKPSLVLSARTFLAG
jgi:hypothetical protein